MLDSTFIIFQNRETICLSYYWLLLETITMKRISFALNYLRASTGWDLLNIRELPHCCKEKKNQLCRLLPGSIKDIGNNLNQLSMMKHLCCYPGLKFIFPLYFYSFVHLFNKNLVSTYYVPSSTLETVYKGEQN